MSVSRNLLFGGVVAAALGFGVALGLAKPEEGRLTFLSVGQGDCAVFQSEGSTILIDDGPTDAAATFTILPALRRLGVGRIDCILLSHPDEDHIAGTGVLHNEFPDAVIAMSAGFRNQPDFQQRLAEWRIRPEEIQWLPHRLAGKVGDFDLDILCPEVTPGTPDNDGSMVVKLSRGSASATFSGDGSVEEEVPVSTEGDWGAQILHVGHHGSRTSTGYTWLQEVHPEIAVISCGLDNRFGHPHPETLARLAERKIRVLRTDRDGTVSFVVQGDAFVQDPKGL